MLKQLLQLLLNTRTTPEEAAHNAMPSEQITEITGNNVSSWGPIASGVAPYDCIVHAQGRGSVKDSQIRVTNQSANFYNQGQYTNAGGTYGYYVPVAKGQTWNVYGSNIENSVIRLVKLIGGGYKGYVWRALSCLKPSFNFLPKFFLRAKNSGLAVKHSLKQLLHWMFRHVPSLHRLMGILDTSTLSAVEAKSCSIWIRVKKCLAVKSLVIAGFLQQTPTARQQYLSRKAVLLLLLPTRCSVKFGLPRLQARHNLRTGGALC